MSHRATCASCSQPYTCPGFAIDNYDGLPPVACSRCDVEGERECRECYDKPQCSWCGLKTGTLLHDTDTGEWNHAECLDTHTPAEMG